MKGQSQCCVLALSLMAVMGSGVSCTDPTESQLNELTTTLCHVSEVNSPLTLVVTAADLAEHLQNHALDSLGSCDTNCKAGVCDDGIACTQDSCLNSGCLHAPANCPQSECSTNGDCNDNNTCTVDTCNMSLGVCAHTPLAAPSPIACVEFEQNQSTPGCFVQAPRDCDDQIGCTTDSCSTATGECVHTLSNSACSSLDNDSQSCTNAKCEPTTLGANANGCVLVDECSCSNDAGCNDNNSCTTDSCNPTLGTCAHSEIPGCCHNATDCNDGTRCTADSCSNGQCAHSTVDCDDNNLCTNDSCSAQGGCTHTSIPNCCTATSDCNDNSLCTTDACVNNRCEHTDTSASCIDDDACTVDSCSAQGGCINTREEGCCNDASDCDDGSLCTTDQCLGNRCSHDITVCPGGGVCDPESGQCEGGNPCPNTICSGDQKIDTATCGCICDQSKCPLLGSDLCHISQCSSVTQHCVDTPISCDDHNPCTDDSCGSFGCRNTPHCDDGDPCTVDACSIKITGGGPRGTPIHATPKCAAKVLTNPACCSDQTACNGSEICQKQYDSDSTGLCVAEITIRECVNETSTPGRPSCPPGIACDKGSVCDDHNACTIDTCGNGVCNHSLSECVAPKNSCGIEYYCTSNGECQSTDSICGADSMCCRGAGGSYMCISCLNGGCSAQDDCI